MVQILQFLALQRFISHITRTRMFRSENQAHGKKENTNTEVI